jgi:hypothetical protein
MRRTTPVRRIFDFRCADGHVTERYIDDSIKEIVCPQCDAEAVRKISPVKCKLDWSFPGESIKWAKKHEEEAKRKTEPTDKVDLPKY